MPELLTLPKTRPGGRHQIGTVGGFMSEWWAASNRNARAECVGIYTLVADAGMRQLDNQKLRIVARGQLQDDGHA